MDFELTERERELQEHVRTLRDELSGTELAPDRFPDAAYRRLCEKGLLGAALPESAGGTAGGLTAGVLVAEALARHVPELVSPFTVNLACAVLILAAGSEAQRARWLRPLSAGRLRAAFALTEPEAGSDAAAIQTRAAACGDGYELTGTKLFTTGAADCDFILTVVRTPGEESARPGFGVFLVPPDAPGLRVTPLRKIGGNHHASCRVEYAGVRVPSENRLGSEDAAWQGLRLAAGAERLLTAAASVGAAEAAFEEARAFVRTREQFGQPIAQFQAVQHRLADMATEVEAMRWLTYRAAWSADRQGPAAAVPVSMAKLYCTERVQQIVLDGMRLLGGRAYLEETPMAGRQREALLGLYAGGTNEIQRNLIARVLLRA